MEIAALKVPTYFPIRYKSEDIEKLPLGTLVSIFSKINNETVLHKSLREITRERNYVAHRSLLFTLGELKDKDNMTEATNKMKEIVGRATAIHHTILDVRNTLVQVLHKVKRS